MGFFSKGDKTETPAATTDEKKPEEAPAEAEKPKQTDAAIKKDKTPKLPKEIQDIIDEAAKNAQKAIFKDDDSIDAAE